MPTLIAIDDRGIPSLEIEDAQSEVHSYRLERVPRGCSMRAYQLTRLDSAESYRLALEITGGWRCSCPAFRYRKSEHAARGCKHTVSVEPLDRFLQTLLEPAREQPRSNATA